MATDYFAFMTSTYNWLKHIPPALLKDDTIPLIGSSPPFPWQSYASKLSEVLSLKDLNIHPLKSFEWHTPDELLKGFSEPIITTITLVPSLAPINWVMSSTDLQTLMTLVLGLDSENAKGVDQDFLQGFYRFLILEALNPLSQIEFDKTLSPQIQEKPNLPKEDALCLDVSIAIKQKTFWGRLILSNEFRQGWKERYTPRSLEVPKPILEHLNVTLSCEVGRCSLKLSEWAKVNLGDFVVLDTCSLKPNGEGRFVLTLNGAPIFRAKVKDGNIKILEHPLYHEEGSNMPDTTHPNEDEEEESDFADDELEDEVSEEYENEEDEDFEEEEELEEAPHEPPKVAAEAPKAAPPSAEPKMPTQAPLGEKKPISPEDIPLSIVVEMGRIQMSLQKVMELQPGNLLELNVKPENGVDLVINGKRIAKGELLLVGEALGVRILDIG